MRFIAPIVLLALAACAAKQPAAADDFSVWLDGVRRDATAEGVPAATVDAALSGVAPLPRVVELDRRQPETTLTFEQYLSRILVPSRIERGRALMAKHGALLRTVEADYGVPAKIVVALWAVESSYGEAMGDYRVVDALATLAYDGRRPDFFRTELIDSLKILGRGRFRSDDLKGSWAGAMGQVQFMPSTYLRYAVDFAHRGQPDIWRDLPDVFASAANYLAELGWRPDLGWGREVRLPAGMDPALIGLPTRRAVADWARLGVRRADGGALPASGIEGSIVTPDGAGGRSFLVYDNFRTIMKWNHSTYFALAIGLLADRIGGR
jgi:membrane-bound lytic murein transglycosylase B